MPGYQVKEGSNLRLQLGNYSTVKATDTQLHRATVSRNQLKVKSTYLSFQVCIAAKYRKVLPTNVQRYSGQCKLASLQQKSGKDYEHMH